MASSIPGVAAMKPWRCTMNSFPGATSIGTMCPGTFEANEIEPDAALGGVGRHHDGGCRRRRACSAPMTPLPPMPPPVLVVIVMESVIQRELARLGDDRLTRLEGELEHRHRRSVDRLFHGEPALLRHCRWSRCRPSVGACRVPVHRAAALGQRHLHQAQRHAEGEAEGQMGDEDEHDVLVGDQLGDGSTTSCSTASGRVTIHEDEDEMWATPGGPTPEGLGDRAVRAG